MKKYLILHIVCLMSIMAWAQDEQSHWRTHFAYNSVQTIALDANEEVFAVSNGKLFSVNPISEKLTMYNNFSGMHGVEIAQIAYDQARKQMLLIYADGKIDIWHADKRMQYMPDLYNKLMTSSKYCNNITIEGKMAYLAMDFGIITMNLERYEIVDTYYIGDEASEVKVLDVKIEGDSIYAKTKDKLYAAHMQEKIVDFRYWSSRPVQSIRWDEKKGKEYVGSNGDVWSVAGAKGIARKMVTATKPVYYLPDGPEVNTPYSLTWSGGKLWMVPGGRWVNQNKNAGHVMIYERGKWTNITQASIKQQTQKDVLDFTSVAVDPQDANHYWVSSFGTGLYEFRADTVVNHYHPGNSIIGSAAPENPNRYTRVDCPVYDEDGVLWVSVAGGVDTNIVAFLPDGTQRGLNLYHNDNRFVLNTPGAILIDRHQPQRKWIVSSRSETGLILLDDGSSRWDTNDDQCIVRKEWMDQNGSIIVPEFIYTAAQAPTGEIWVGTSAGPIIIPQDINMLESNSCIRLTIPAADGTPLLETERINAFAWDDQGQIWIGTQTGGVYILDAKCEQVVDCYTSSNSVMPSNCVLSLAWDSDLQIMYIGTGSGLVSYVTDPEVLSSVELYDEEEDTNNHTGIMYSWRAHNAFTSVDDVACMGDYVYGLSAKSLVELDASTGVIKSLSKLDGLNASNANHIAHNSLLNKTLVTYENGQFDVLTADGNVHAISDLFLKHMSGSKQVNDICMYQHKAFLAMNWGILVVNLRKMEIEDTYYIGKNASEVNVRSLCIMDDQLYALTNNNLYHARLTDNLIDYAYWKTHTIPAGASMQFIRAWNNQLYVLADNLLYAWRSNSWVKVSPYKYKNVCHTGDELWLVPSTGKGMGRLDTRDGVTWALLDVVCNTVTKDGNTYWVGTQEDGLVHYDATTTLRESYIPDGPSSNYAYKLRFAGDKLYMLPGGRWADRYKRPGDIMIYEEDEWHNLRNSDLKRMNNNNVVLDLMNVAQDPKDANHYFVTSYGTGLYEMYQDSIIKTYLPDNSPLQSAAPDVPLTFTRTDGITYDKEGNLWVINAGGGETNNIHVITPDGQWYAYQALIRNKAVEMHTPGDILIDQRYPNWKWIPLLRYTTGLILLNDQGTPTNYRDDKVTYRTNWTDQYNYYLAPNEIYTVAQDHNHALWIGTDDGIIVIPPTVDFQQSDKCIRVIMPRNDGTDLVDFLLDNERINTIQVDGANRLWVGTENSGVFLLKPSSDNVSDPMFTVETVAHFTTENSILPSNQIITIAIHPTTGEVFLGTAGGLVSYMSDATTPSDNYETIYSYPNPVRPGYQGHVTFQGLVANSEVRVVDAGGNLVKRLISEGGTATWDMTNASGQRVGSGVYTAICNTADGTQHGTTKVLIMQ